MTSTEYEWLLHQDKVENFEVKPPSWLLRDIRLTNCKRNEKHFNTIPHVLVTPNHNINFVATLLPYVCYSSES